MSVVGFNNLALTCENASWLAPHSHVWFLVNSSRNGCVRFARFGEYDHPHKPLKFGDVVWRFHLLDGRCFVGISLNAVLIDEMPQEFQLALPKLTLVWVQRHSS